jgi:hypothetical protein
MEMVEMLAPHQVEAVVLLEALLHQIPGQAAAALAVALALGAPEELADLGRSQSIGNLRDLKA